ncbi:MAG: hypothetical protein Q9168_000949 [Polycauliona sp. 1 TL-2023]
MRRAYVALRVTVLVRRARYSTASLAQEHLSLSSTGTSSSEESNSLGPSASAEQQGSAISTVQPIIRQVNTTRIGKRKNARSQAEKLAVYQRGKAFRNQMLKDRGSWSYDWRLPLENLEKYHVLNGSSRWRFLPNPIPIGKANIPHNIRADQIETPPTWTESTFYSHVTQLTSSKVDRLVARRIYSREESHTIAVAEALALVFADPSLKYFVSVEAGNVALRFLFRKGKVARAHDLFGQLQELQKDHEPSTYNVMLRAAAEQKDLHTFTFILKMMIIHRVGPNTQTWLHLVRAVREDEVRTIIINRMGEKGLLSDAATMKEAVAILMPQLVVQYLDSESTAHDLIHMLDNHYGSDWCSTSAAEQLIDGVGLRHSTEEAMIILGKLCDRGYRPSQGMLLQLLRQCSWTKAHGFAVELLRAFRAEHDIEPSLQIYDVLFKQAWKSQLYNCCRVLWIHACVKGHTSFDMQQTIKESLFVQRRASPSPQSRSNIFKEISGKVITGHGRRNDITRFRALVSLWKPIKASRRLRDKFLRAVRSILYGDLAVVGRYKIRKPLDVLLREALRTDRQWAIGHALKDVPMECKYSQLIHVDLIPTFNANATDDTDLGRNQAGDDNTDSDACCWMSDSMRSRPCICSENTRKQPNTIPAVDSNAQEDTAAAVSSSCN